MYLQAKVKVNSVIKSDYDFNGVKGTSYKILSINDNGYPEYYKCNEDVAEKVKRDEEYVLGGDLFFTKDGMKLRFTSVLK